MSEKLTPEALGRALREEDGPLLQNRRWVVGLSLYNILAMSAISLYQMGILESVPEVHLPGEDADAINGSAQAYEILQTPDAVLAIGSYAATAALAAMGPPDRVKTLPWPALGMGIKALADAAFAAKLLWDQPTKYKAYCSWCVTGALASLAAAALAWPEAQAAWKQLRGEQGEEQAQ